jgi:integrase
MRKKLTDLTIQKLPHQKQQIDYWDAAYPSLALRVGALRKTWVVSIGKPRRRIKLGLYPHMGLSEARRRAAQLNSSTPYSITVETAAEEYLRSLTTRPRTQQDYNRLLGRITPLLGKRRLIEITARDVIAITDTLRDRPAECRHLHAVMSGFFNWCVPRYLSQSPMLGLKPPAPQNKRSRVLSYDELKKIWAASDELAHYGRLIRLCLLSGQRRGAIKAIAYVPNTLENTLTFPANLMKSNTDHTIPLTKRIDELFLNFATVPYHSSKQKAKLDKLSGVTGWVVHDLRRTFSTHINDIDPKLHSAVERVLAHAVPGVAGIYNRAQLIQQQREVLELWEAELIKRCVIA